MRCSRWRPGRGVAAFAAIPSASASTTTAASFGRLFFGRLRTRLALDRMGFGLRLGFRGRSLLYRRRDCVKNDCTILERRTSFRNRRRNQLREIELRIAEGFSTESRCSLLRFRFPVGAAKTFSGGGIPLGGFGVLAGGFEHTRQLEGNHCVLRFLVECR